MHFTSITLALATAILSVTGSIIPLDQSAANLLEKRADLRCPGSDNDIYTGPNGGQWRIRCARDCSNDKTIRQPINYISFENCIIECGKRPDTCSIANFSGDVSSGTCYLKGSCGGLEARDGTKTAIKLNG